MASQIPNDMPYLSEMTMWTAKNEVYNVDVSTTTPEYIEFSYYYSPFILWIIIAVCVMFIASRLIIEFLIRWRK